MAIVIWKTCKMGQCIRVYSFGHPKRIVNHLFFIGWLGESTSNLGPCLLEHWESWALKIGSGTIESSFRLTAFLSGCMMCCQPFIFKLPSLTMFSSCSVLLWFHFMQWNCDWLMERVVGNFAKLIIDSTDNITRLMNTVQVQRF